MADVSSSQKRRRSTGGKKVAAVLDGLVEDNKLALREQRLQDCGGHKV